MTMVFNILAYSYWDKFLSTNSVYDGKHSFTFFGENAYGHLAFASLGLILFSCFYQVNNQV